LARGKGRFVKRAPISLCQQHNLLLRRREIKKGCVGNKRREGGRGVADPQLPKYKEKGEGGGTKRAPGKKKGGRAKNLYPLWCGGRGKKKKVKGGTKRCLCSGGLLLEKTPHSKRKEKGTKADHPFHLTPSKEECTRKRKRGKEEKRRRGAPSWKRRERGGEGRPGPPPDCPIWPRTKRRGGRGKRARNIEGGGEKKKAVTPPISRNREKKKGGGGEKI